MPGNSVAAGRPSSGRCWVLCAVLAFGAAVAGCDFDTDFAETMVENQAERNRQRSIEQQREELPLPDPEAVDYKSYFDEDLPFDDNFRINLVDDLVLGEGRVGPEYLFVRFTGSRAALGNVAVDDEGHIFVLETRSDEIRVFDPDGGFLYKFGQPGQGPGDFQSPYGMIVAGNQVTVFHRSFFSSIWTLGGGFVRDRETLRTPEAQESARLQAPTPGTALSREESQRRAAARRFRTPVQVIANETGALIMAFRAEPTDPSGRVSTPFVRVVGQFEDGVEAKRYIEVPEWASPSLAVAPSGDLYVGMLGHLATELYIVALDAAGEPRFVIVTPWDPQMPPGAYLRVDSDGRLFVFPNFRADAEDPNRPAHVYTSEGELIGSGYLNRRPVWAHWQVTTSDGIYGVRLNPETEEWEVVRYRLEVGER